jgi:hypothetical protein
MQKPSPVTVTGVKGSRRRLPQSVRLPFLFHPSSIISVSKAPFADPLRSRLGGFPQ